ncbi:MAG: hypothetical protein H6737_02350 [Alphaproteobacteria bacterium]|nr:hypothetical protein [Alphaproteobacteria bacterium]
MFVIGAGRIGTSLKKRSEAHDIDVELVTRTEGWDRLEFAVPGDPIVVAVRNDDLLEVIERVPDYLHDDLVFIQNGLFRALLRNNGLMNATRGLVYFAARERGGAIEPGGTNWFCGPHSLTMARWMAVMGLRGRSVDWARFSYFELEKLTWICTLGPLCEKYDLPVGEVVEKHADELRAVVDEFQSFGRIEFSVHPKADYLFDRVVEYSRSIPGFRAGVKEWEWRNGAVLQTIVEHEATMPLHVKLLTDAGHGAKVPESLVVR